MKQTTCIEIGSKWIDKNTWGDVDGICQTADSDKKTVFTVIEVLEKDIKYIISYLGNSEPDKIHTSSKEQFLIDLKPISKNLSLCQKIDVEPLIEKANDFWKICMEMREIDSLYVFRLKNGTNYSVEFDEKSFLEFCPKQTVSDLLKMWEEGITREYTTALNAIETRIHPHWKANRKVLHPITQIWTGKYEDCDYIMQDYEVDGFKRIAERKKAQLGELTFIKISL